MRMYLLLSQTSVLSVLKLSFPEDLGDRKGTGIYFAVSVVFYLLTSRPSPCPSHSQIQILVWLQFFLKRRRQRYLT